MTPDERDGDSGVIECSPSTHVPCSGGLFVEYSSTIVSMFVPW